jgi:hypothetical protein
VALLSVNVFGRFPSRRSRSPGVPTTAGAGGRRSRARWRPARSWGSSAVQPPGPSRALRSGLAACYEAGRDERSDRPARGAVCPRDPAPGPAGVRRARCRSAERRLHDAGACPVARGSAETCCDCEDVAGRLVAGAQTEHATRCEERDHIEEACEERGARPTCPRGSPNDAAVSRSHGDLSPELRRHIRRDHAPYEPVQRGREPCERVERSSRSRGCDPRRSRGARARNRGGDRQALRAAQRERFRRPPRTRRPRPGREDPDLAGRGVQPDFGRERPAVEAGEGLGGEDRSCGGGHLRSPRGPELRLAGQKTQVAPRDAVERLRCAHDLRDEPRMRERARQVVVVAVGLAVEEDDGPPAFAERAELGDIDRELVLQDPAVRRDVDVAARLRTAGAAPQRARRGDRAPCRRCAPCA